MTRNADVQNPVLEDFKQRCSRYGAPVQADRGGKNAALLSKPLLDAALQLIHETALGHALGQPVVPRRRRSERTASTSS